MMRVGTFNLTVDEHLKAKGACVCIDSLWLACRRLSADEAGQGNGDMD